MRIFLRGSVERWQTSLLDQSTFGRSDWNQPMMMRFGLTLLRIASRWSQRTRISANGVSCWASRRKSSGCDWATARPGPSNPYCGIVQKRSRTSWPMSRSLSLLSRSAISNHQTSIVSAIGSMLQLERHALNPPGLHMRAHPRQASARHRPLHPQQSRGLLWVRSLPDSSCACATERDNSRLAYEENCSYPLAAPVQRMTEGSVSSVRERSWKPPLTPSRGCRCPAPSRRR